MAKPKITIIGLGLIGASFGLALQKEEADFEIVGHDKEPEVAQGARRTQAVHRTEWNLHRACEHADMILLAVPLSEFEDLFREIAEDLKPGCLVLAATPVLQPAIELADRHLPGHVHFVAGHPVLAGVGGTLSVRADLFDGVVFSLAPGLQTEPAAVQLASDFVERIGATPLFVDAQEHDGIIAAVEQLPQVMAVALMRLSSSSAGWREARRLAGRQFAQATETGAGAQQLFSTLTGNRENILLRIEQLQQELAEWRELLLATPEPDEKHPLLAALEEAMHARTRWEAQALLKNWEESPGTGQSREAEGAGMFRQMFLGGFMGRRPRDRE
ncbi:MAG: prephenate dehydrogenase [Litorilinea sp.]|nr:MAG: prephenate dehydrogenase [Litorilinea sp.]